MKNIFILLIAFASASAEDFISKFEYGQMLYNNPRGVSCASCHGETGEGKHIASYKSREGKTIDVVGSDIRSSTLEELRKAVLHGKGLMPRYFLTDEEVETIYSYLKELNSPTKSPDDTKEETGTSAAKEDIIPNEQAEEPKKIEKKPKINPWEGLE